jgi:peptidyl-prolyl cis-trans isomerase A (cyclophilin A)
MLAPIKKCVSCLSFVFACSLTLNTQAPTVQFQTVMGDFEVNLYDKATPKTVANFLAYVQANAYQNTVIHRSVSDFIVQGGGFTYPNKLPLVAIPQNAAVMNEPVYSNRRGTIAMAKLGTDANSATNQWFFNVANNSANLDFQNSGFTVFGEVTGNGMAIVDAMALLTRFKGDGAFNEIPLRNYTTADFNANVTVTDANFVIIRNIVVLNANVDTAAALTPEKNTANSAVVSPSSSKSSSGNSGGGQINIVGLFMLMIMIASLRAYRFTPRADSLTPRA